MTATWDEHIQAIAAPQLEKAKCYYYNGQARIEIAPQGFDHSSEDSLIGYAVALFTGIKRIPLSGVTLCTFRKPGEADCQPDLALYIGESAEIIPFDTSMVDLDVYPPPDLVIEIAKTSLSDDLGSKRMLYERLGVAEYWVGASVPINCFCYCWRRQQANRPVSSFAGFTFYPARRGFAAESRHGSQSALHLANRSNSGSQ